MMYILRIQWLFNSTARMHHVYVVYLFIISIYPIDIVIIIWHYHSIRLFIKQNLIYSKTVENVLVATGICQKI
jgi:hypothetical protein